MRISRKRCARVAVFTARANCIRLATAGSLAVVPSKTGSARRRFGEIAFAAIRTGAVSDIRRLRFGSWAGRFTGALSWCWSRRCTMASSPLGLKSCARPWGWTAGRWNAGASGGCRPLPRAPSGKPRGLSSRRPSIRKLCRRPCVKPSGWIGGIGC